MARKSRTRRGSGGRGSGPGRSKRPATNRQYPRTARLNTLLHEIVADFFERIDDERFELLTITGVEVDSDLNRAQVFVTTLGSVGTTHLADGDTEVGTEVPADPDDVLLDALDDYRKAVQRKISSEARIRKTPEVVFQIDPAVRSGARIEEILATIRSESDPDGLDDVDAPQEPIGNGDQPVEGA